MTGEDFAKGCVAVFVCFLGAMSLVKGLTKVVGDWMRGGRKATPGRGATREVCQEEWVQVDHCAEGEEDRSK
eukprot:8642354-Ditylum_brightwellii.AAC.1